MARNCSNCGKPISPEYEKVMQYMIFAFCSQPCCEEYLTKHHKQIVEMHKKQYESFKRFF